MLQITILRICLKCLVSFVPKIGAFCQSKQSGKIPPTYLPRYDVVFLNLLGYFWVYSKSARLDNAIYHLETFLLTMWGLALQKFCFYSSKISKNWKPNTAKRQINQVGRTAKMEIDKCYKTYIQEVSITGLKAILFFCSIPLFPLLGFESW